MKSIPAVWINGFKVQGPSSKRSLIEGILNSKKILLAINAEKIYHGNQILRQISTSGIAYPDGVGAVFALYQKGIKDVVRTPGSELWLDLIHHIEGKRSLYIIGATQQVLDKTLEKLGQDYPRLEIVGARNGYFSQDEEAGLVCDIKNKKPDVILVAQGSPRQELLMQKLHRQHEAIYMGLGGSFDVYTGKVKRAPVFFRSLGLEWFYRLLLEPSRFKRQKVLFPFAVKLLLNRF